MNTNKIATGSTNKKLLAALAVLAVAFVVLAAVPAVATDSDAADAQSITVPTTNFGTATTISSASDITGITDGVVTLTANTFWKLSADVTISGLQMNGYSLEVTSASSVKRTLTIENDDGTGLLSKGLFADGSGTSGAKSAVVLKLDNVNLAINSTGDVEAEQIRVNLLSESQFYLDADNAAITITDNTSGSPKTLQSQFSVFDLNRSTFDVTTETGMSGGHYWKLVNSTVTTHQSDSNEYTNVTGYFDLSGASSVSTRNASVYAMALAGSSSFTASGWADVYGNNAQMNSADRTIANFWTLGTDTKMVLSQITLGEGTSASAEEWDVSDGMNHGKLPSSVIDAIKVGGTGGSLSGEFGYATSVIGKISVPAGGSIVLDRGEVISTVGTDGAITFGVGATLILDADQHQPVVFTSRANGTTITSVYTAATTTASASYALGLSAGSLELTSGSYYIGSSDSMSLTGTATFTIASGAAIKVDNSNISSGATLLSLASTGTFVNNGVLAMTSVPDTTGTDTAVLSAAANDGISGLSVAQIKAVVKAYGITVAGTITDTNVTGITVDKIGYSGEVIDATPSVKEGYVTEKVGYGNVPASDSKFSFATNAVRNVGYDSWSFTMPAKSIQVEATAVGAYTATFIAVDSSTYEPLAQYTSEPYDGTTTTSISVPSFNLTDYKAVGYYKESGLLNKDSAVNASAGTVTVSKSNVTIYVAMDKLYKVEYERGVSGAIRAQADSPVSVTVSAPRGYEFVASSGVTVSYTLDGVAKTMKAVAPTGSDTAYTFQMPAADVVVSAVFQQKFTVTSPAFGSDTTVAHAPVTISHGTATGTASTAIKASSDSAVQGTQILVTVGNITNPTGDTRTYVVADLVFTDSAGNELEIPYKYDSSVQNYTFQMPGQNVTLTVSLGPAQTLTVSSSGTSGKTTVTAAGATIETTGSVAVGALVTIDAVPSAVTKTQTTLYAVKTFTIEETASNVASGSTARSVPFEQDGTTYTFDMPNYPVTVTIVYDKGYVIEKVDIQSVVNAGSVDYKDVIGTAYAEGAEVEFAVSVTDGYRLTSVAFTYTQTTTSDSTTTTSTVTTTASDFSTTDDTKKIYYDVEGGSVTMTMPASDVSRVVFYFSEIVYVSLTVNVTDGNDFAVYSDSEYENEIAAASDGTYSIEVGQMAYIVITTSDGSTIVSANATKYTPASGTSQRPVPASTVAYALTVVESPADNSYVRAVYGITPDDDAPTASYTVNATIAVSELQAAKNAATDYIESVRDSASMQSERIDGNTFAVSADASDSRIITTALNAVDAATTLAAVTAAQNAFDDAILPFVKTAVQADLETAYNNGAAYNGYVLSLADYNTALAAIAAVQDDSDESIQEEVDTVISAYETAMDSRTSVTPEPSADAATQVLAGFYGEGQIMIVGVDGYVPAGDIVLSLTATTASGASFTFTAKLAVANTEQKTTLTVALDADALEVEQSAYSQLLSSVYAVSIHYEAGSVVSTETPVSNMKLAQE